MFSLSRAILFVVFCAASAVAQDRNVQVEYDRFKDVTTYGFDAMKTSNPTVLILAMFQCPGQSKCKPESVVFVFAIATLDGSPYEGSGIARAIRDGVRQDPYKLKYGGIKTLGPLPTHAFAAMLRPESLIKIANSKLVEYQIDSTEFALTPENLAILRALADRMQQ